jgi:hypothetical protein
MRKEAAARFLAVTLILCVCVLATQAVGHRHDNPVDEQHCQVCHIGHAAIPQPAIQPEIQHPLSTDRVELYRESFSGLDSINALSIPRAPPA